jgi:hypothetical protein
VSELKKTPKRKKKPADASAPPAVMGAAPAKIKEPAGNLKQREAWFRKRSGDA